jgi:voltage-gated potassium channel
MNNSRIRHRPSWIERWHRLWAQLQAENIPRLTAYFLGVLLLGAPAIYYAERKANDQFKTLEDGLWWSLVTLTTIGYGDKYPITHTGRLLAFVVVLVGIGLVGIVTGKIASALVDRKIKEGRGLTDAHELKGHIVILGWKSDMGLLVEDLLTAHPDLGPGRLVLVNTAGDLANEELRNRFPGLVYIHGDTIDPAVQQRAGVTHASRVLVLADEAGDRSDQEVDARTVMAVMNLENLAPDVYTYAEVLDRKFIEHLRLARCDEIILSREYGRFMLVNASVSAGISQVLHDLLDVEDPHGMATVPIPEGFEGRTFGDLASHFKAAGGDLLIGVLENTGQSLAIKREALRAAQKTEDVATLLENLRGVKDLVSNKPVLNPPDAYTIPPHARGIVIGRGRRKGAA